MGGRSVRHVAASDCLVGGGEMGAFMRAFDWSSTPLGPVADWPQSLCTSVSICLNSRFPMLIWWGPDLIMLYNDGYRQIIGGKHPAALGHPGRGCWHEIWHIVGPMLQSVLETGEATWSDDLQLLLERHGYPEECYFTFSYSPIRDERGGVGGVFTPVKETTEKVIGERRLRTLRDLAARTTKAPAAAAACRIATETLADNPQDIPFALAYLVDASGARAQLAGAAGIEPGTAASPSEVEFGDGAGEGEGWPLGRVARTGKAEIVTALDRRFGALPRGAWSDPPRSALVLPVILPGHVLPRALVVAAVSPRKDLDAAYRTFYDFVAGQFAVAMADALALEDERRRAEALLELDRAKTAFFSNVSHEFRTPLTLMLGPIEDLLAAPPGARAGERDQLAVIHRNGLRLLKLVNTLLDFSRIEAGRVQAAYEPTDLASASAELAGVFRSAIERAGMRLVVDCPPLPAPVYVDREMWEKIVLNLLSNAFKFTPAGEITVAMRPAGGAVELSVRDTGIGIPAHQLPHLFQRFHRVEGSWGRTQEGTGIGLALVQELVALHGGSVRVASEVGRGSTFTVTLPFGAAHLPPDRIGVPRGPASAGGARPYLAEAMGWLPGERVPEGPARLAPEQLCLGAPSGAPLAPRFAAGSRPRILLADDNADMREYLRRLLKDQYEVEALTDGEAALAAIRDREELPDLILSDVMMPGLDGMELLRAVRADPRARAVPLILLSARAGEEARVDGLEAGADDYLIKPFSARELLARVGAHLEMARLRRDAACREQALRAETQAMQRHLETVLAGISDAFVTLDREWRYTFLNDRAAEMIGRPKESLLGRSIWEVFPDTVGGTFHQELHRAMAEGLVGRFEYFYPAWSRWFEFRIYPSAGGLSLFATDITDRKVGEEERQRRMAREAAARCEAEAANRAKDEFLATLGHELRNPLGAIANAVAVLEQVGSKDGPAAGMLAIIGRQVRISTRLVEDLLDVARAASGKMVLQREPVDLRELAERCLAALGQRHPEVVDRYAVALRGEPVWVEGDPARLEQVLTNLLENAIKYTPEGGQIGVGVLREGDRAVLRVRDSGAGIAPELLPRVFDLFVQATQTLDRAQGGLGIGLTLVRRLVALHGGTVEAASEGVGRGSEFVVRLPLARAVGAVPCATIAAAAPPPRRVLVVEDHEDARRSMRILLEKSGHDVAEAAAGEQAVEMALARGPDIALIDIGLPGMDGYEVARRIRGAPAGRAIRLVALTGYGQAEDRDRAVAAGFDAHLVKPVDLVQLEAILAPQPRDRGVRATHEALASPGPAALALRSRSGEPWAEPEPRGSRSPHRGTRRGNGDG